MAQVKFVNRVKYNGTWYAAHTPFDVKDEDVSTLVEKGAIVTIPAKEKEKSIDDMKLDELKKYAEEHDIDISGIEKKADILAAIKAAESSEE